MAELKTCSARLQQQARAGCGGFPKRGMMEPVLDERALSMLRIDGYFRLIRQANALTANSGRERMSP